MSDTFGRDVVTKRRACRVLGQARNTQRRKACVADDEPQLVKRIVWIASEYGWYGYRRITALLRAEGWWVNHERVERIWRQEGLKVPAKQPKRRRLWLGDGSCIRLRPTHRNHVWSYDCVMDRTADGRAFRMLTIVDEFTRECLAIDVSRKLTSEDVLERLSDLFVRKGVPDHIRSDNGSEFTAKRVREWRERVGVKTLYIEPGSPWENGYIESVSGKLRGPALKPLFSRAVRTVAWDPVRGCGCRCRAVRRATPEGLPGRKWTSTSSPQSVDGPRAGETGDGSSGSPRCARIFRIGPGSVMNAMSRMLPLHPGHSSGNSSPTRAMSLAHAIREVSWEGGDGGPELVIRGEHPVIAMPVLPRRRHEVSEPVEELKGRKLDAAGARPCGLPPAPRADPVGRLVSGEHVADAGDAAVFAAHHGEPLQREGRPATVSQQVLERLTIDTQLETKERDPDACVH